MKRIEIIVLLVFLNVLVTFGEGTTFTLTINSPDKVEDTFLYWGQEVIKGVNLQETNWGQNTSIQVSAWTYDAIPGIERGLIKFDMDQLPANAEIVKAELSLYHLEYNVNQYQPMSNLSGSNEVYLKRVTSDWVEDEVTWNTQPSTTDQYQATLPESNSRNQDYLNIDVTELISEIFVSGANYGFMLKLATEEYFRSMFFCSSEYEDSNMHPKLVIEYRIKESHQAPISNVRKISATQGGFTGQLDDTDLFGMAATVIGDVDGDGVEDMAVNGGYDDDGGIETGAVYILFMNKDRTVKRQQKISALEGNFHGLLHSGDYFGWDIASLGDFDNDGIPDVAVGAYGDSDGFLGSGAVWILLLNQDGTVKNHQKISATQGGIVGLTANREFGWSVTSLGDLDKDGIADIAVGSPNYDDEGGLYKGCVWILFLNSDGTVRAQQKINDYQGGFAGILYDENRFGSGVENIGDINGDGIVDIAVQTLYDDDGASNAGAFYILFLNSNGTVKQTQKISAIVGGFNGTIKAEDRFGYRIVSLGDIDGDDISDLLTSSYGADEGLYNRGKAWILFLNRDATVKDYYEITYQNSVLSGLLEYEDCFGTSVAVFNELNDNNKKEIVIGAGRDDDGATDAGAVYILDLDVVSSHQAPISNVRKISATQGGFTGQLEAGGRFSLAEVIGDVDGDGIEDMAVGASRGNYGSVWILFMNEDKTVKGSQKISATEGNFTGHLDPEDSFGKDIASLGDLDGDGVLDIAVGAWGDGDVFGAGAVWILFLNSNGTVKNHQKISATQGGLVGLTASRQFGFGVTSLGDLNGDGITDIAVGSPTYDNDGGLYRGCVWILFLNSNGTVKSQQKINDYQGGFTGILDNEDRFGISVENIGDINADGIVDISVSSMYDDDGASNAGAFYILFLNSNGTVKHTQKISARESSFDGVVAAEDRFGCIIASLGDIDGDGVNDLLTSSNLSDDGGLDKGKVWVIYLNSDATVKDYDEINYQSPALLGLLDNGDNFGVKVSVFKRFNDAGKKEIVIGALGDDDGATDAGAVYILDLDVKHKPIAVAGNDQILCEGDTLVIDGSGSSVLDNDVLSYSWVCSNYEITNSRVRTFTFKTPVVTEPTIYNFILTVYCQGIPSIADTVSTTVNPVPQIPTVQLAGDSLLASKADQYQWYFNGTLIAGASGQTYAPTADGDFSIIVTSQIGCSSQPSNVLNVLIKPVAVAKGMKTVCSGSALYLDGTSSYAPNANVDELTYKWTCEDMIVPGSSFAETTLIAPKVTKLTPKEFVLQVFRGELASAPDTLHVEIYPAPQTPTIQQFGDTLLASGALEYQWYKENFEIDGEYDSTLVISQSGNYRVKVMNDLGCVSDISDALYVIYSSIEELDCQINVFPNPTNSMVRITGLPCDRQTLINVYDMNAQLILSETFKDGSGEIDFSGFNRGQYLIVLDNNYNRAVKIMKK